MASNSKSLTAIDLASYSRERLPAYMIPSRYLIVERFPKTLNGKIDRKALPPVEQAQAPAGQSNGPLLDEMESRVAKIWEDVLQVSGIGREDNFFFLGGSSLLVTRVISKLKRELDLELPVRDVFANPILQSLAMHLKSMLGEASPSEQTHSVCRGNRLPKIESQFIDSAAEKLFSVYYSGRSVRKDHSVLICGSVGHEYSRSHRNLQQLAQMLSEQGFDVLRFDYSSTGNSSGLCERGMPQQWCLDIRNAAAWLKDRSKNERLSFIGLRLGATLISNTEGLSGEQLILWDPAVSGERFLSQLAQYHRRALQDFVRYSNQRLAEPNQFYGFSIHESAMMALCKMKLKFTSQNSFRRTSLLTTKNYWSDETLNTSVPAKSKTVVHQEVDDEVLWHWSQYTESAFSSANSYRWILNQLTGSKA